MVVTPPAAAADHPDISVILCTYNPRPDLFAEVLQSLARQTLPPTRWELLIIDNNSTPPVTLLPLPPSPPPVGWAPPTSPLAPASPFPGTPSSSLPPSPTGQAQGLQSLGLPPSPTPVGWAPPTSSSPLPPSPGTPGEGRGEGSAPPPERNRDAAGFPPSPTLHPPSSSSPPLTIRIIPEPHPGLNHARRTGIQNARADLLVFVDDDNLLDPDYLETALAISKSHPNLGAYGGLTRPRLERPHLPRWKRRLLDKLGVRDNGPAPLTSSVDRWGPWEPIGAGLVLRRQVAEHFVHLMQTSPHAPRLDRSGPTGLMSGGDTLMARSAYRVGLACSYQPALKLTHVIKSSRLDTKYLLRILHAHGKSVVVLNQALGVPVPRMTLPGLLLRFPYRLLTRGPLTGLALYAWDLGYYHESHRRPRADQ